MNYLKLRVIAFKEIKILKFWLIASSPASVTFLHSLLKKVNNLILFIWLKIEREISQMRQHFQTISKELQANISDFTATRN